MVGGFNHNFRYKGEIYHVQTEDSGVKNPHIITLLYRGGTILASKKTSYADRTGASDLEQIVEALMKGQHKEMLRRLRDGELDHLLGGAAPTPVPPSATPLSASPPPVAPAPSRPPVKPGPVPLTVVKPAAPAARPATPAPSPPAEKQTRVLDSSLDEVILSYLVGDDKP